ncbi:SDR family oxidoreductase [Kineosporia sp. NBRC 101731]|uniref:SDR family NAD(P)-dependent oxidoreductase n=1 Tax=Kineosporia sp. NBRC 101731 TaxID=3032199 RepID=UPI0024A42089|nr:SDR family oxidoreductase [Kineosporia sp. NBRC 101731]GLY28370.1 short-chain dehydrogenase [Kineosporia sp. NBRC 101731]
MSDFNGLVAIVTGGAGAIGLATAELLRDRGAQVVAFDIKPDGLPGDILGIEVDVTDDAQVKAAVDSVVERFGRLDVVVNNVGIAAVGNVTENSDEEWLGTLNTNVVSMVRVARHAVPHLRRSPAAAIVNTSSIVAWAGLERRVLYSASKGAISALTQAMAADHVREGIRVNAVAPGAVDSPWVNGQLSRTPDPESARAAMNATLPIDRLVAAAEVAGAIAYLASPLSGATVGTVLAVDGGIHGLRMRPATQKHLIGR